MDFIWVISGTVLFLVTLPGNIELLYLTVGAIFSALKPQNLLNTPTFHSKGIIIIPAHNEEMTIAKTLKAMQNCTGDFDYVVVADNCTDSTAQICQQHGVKVLVRNDPEKKGKSYALDFAFQILLNEPYDWFAVVDADTLVQSNLATEISRLFDQQADAVQVRNSIENPHLSIKTRLMCIAFLAFNYLRPKGRQFWNHSVGILGTGFALSRKVLQTVPYTTSSIVEDLAYHIKLVKAGFKVRFTDRTKVVSDFPVHKDAVTTQRTRWEGGRFAVMRHAIPELALAVFKGQWQLLDPLLDLLLLPLAYHVVLLFLLCLIPISFFQLYALISLCLVLGHILTAIIIGGGTMKDFLALLLSPFYIIWKLLLLTKTFRFSSKSSEWIRTDRNQK